MIWICRQLCAFGAWWRRASIFVRWLVVILYGLVLTASLYENITFFALLLLAGALIIPILAILSNKRWSWAAKLQAAAGIWMVWGILYCGVAILWDADWDNRPFWQDYQRHFVQNNPPEEFEKKFWVKGERLDWVSVPIEYFGTYGPGIETMRVHSYEEYAYLIKRHSANPIENGEVNPLTLEYPQAFCAEQWEKSAPGIFGAALRLSGIIPRPLCTREYVLAELRRAHRP